MHCAIHYTYCKTNSVFNIKEIAQNLIRYFLVNSHWAKCHKMYNYYSCPLKSIITDLNCRFNVFFTPAYLLNSVERGSYWYEGHDDYGHCVVIVFIYTPQNNTEELEDVERIEDLEKRKRLVSLPLFHLPDQTFFFTRVESADSHCTRTSLISSLKREGTFTSISFRPKKNLLK